MQYNGINEGTNMMVNNIEEQEFFLSHLTKNMDVLEFGCGESTLTIAPRVKSLHSIEHNAQWAEEVIRRLEKSITTIAGMDSLHQKDIPMSEKGYVWHLDNVNIHVVGQNAEPSADYDDGTYSDFWDYVNSVQRFNKQTFDVIFIDGRARAYCAARCLPYLKKDGLIFIHDYAHPKEEYRRPEYEVVEEFLVKTGQVFALAKFVIKEEVGVHIAGNSIVIDSFDQSRKVIQGKSSEVKNETVNKSTCWYSDEVVDEMNRFHDMHINNQDVTKHFKAFTDLLTHPTVEKLITDRKLIDLGCGGAAVSQFCSDFEYHGADLPHVIIGCAMRNYPQYLYKSCDLIEDDLQFLARYDVIVMNGVIDIMQYPLEMLKKVLKAMMPMTVLIIHRQEITEKGQTHTVVNGSYNSTTYHSIISRADFQKIVDEESCEVVAETVCGFANWENGGSSFLISK